MASSSVSTASRVNCDYEEYKLLYSTYLLRKLQNRVACKVKEAKEQELKKCLISLKLEYEELLQNHVCLRKEIFSLNLFVDFMRDINKNISSGKEVLKTLEENNFDALLLSLSKAIHVCTSQLELVDLSKESFEELLSKKMLGCGSEMEKSLQLINEFIEKNQLQISKIADELRDIQSLWRENSLLRQRFDEMFTCSSNEILDINYKHFIEKVKNCVERKEELTSNGCFVPGNLINVKDVLKSTAKSESSLEISQIETSQKMDYHQLTNLDGHNPRSSSTPRLLKTPSFLQHK